MFIDTSAFIAIFLGEPNAKELAIAIENAPRRFTSPLVRLETCMVLSTRANMAPHSAQIVFEAFVGKASISMLTINDRIGVMAVAAFERYGKGRQTKAGLNLADCMSYACARANGLPILFVGKDFAHTDIDSVLG